MQAVKKAGLEGKVFVFGIDGSEQLAKMLLDPDNVLQAVTAQQPLEVGRRHRGRNALIEGRRSRPGTVPVLGLNRADKAGVDKLPRRAQANDVIDRGRGESARCPALSATETGID